MTANREHTPVRLLSLGLCIWAVILAAFIMRYGYSVTSRQWQYLMSVPLVGKWFWTVLFGLPGIIGIIGWKRTNYSLKTISLVLIGLGCLGIAVFYLLAPVLIEDLFTLGWLIWVLGSGVAFYLGVVNSRDREW